MTKILWTTSSAVEDDQLRFHLLSSASLPRSGPYVDIDMRSGDMEGYDAVFLSPHKFVGGPGTSGILLMNKALYQLKTSPPSTCGGGTVAYVNGFDEKVNYMNPADPVIYLERGRCRIFLEPWL